MMWMKYPPSHDVQAHRDDSYAAARFRIRCITQVLQMLLCQGCRRAVVRCDGRGWWTQWFLAASCQRCIVPPFQEYFFCIFTAIVSCRYQVFDSTLLPSTSESGAYTLADHKKREALK